MLRMRSLLSAVFSLALMVSAAQVAGAASWVLAANGGVSIPTGDFGDKDLLDAQAGFQVGGALDYMINDQFAVGVDGSWNQNKHGAEGESMTVGSTTLTLTEDKFRTWQVGAHAKFFLPMTGGAVSPYLLGGAGIYSTTEKWEQEENTGGVITMTSGEESTDSRFGGKVGVGALYRVNDIVGVGVEGNYNFISQDKDKVGVSSLQYIGIHAGVSFSIVPR